MKKRPLNKKPGDWIGSMKGSAEILGDIVSPVSEEADWEAAQDEKAANQTDLSDPVE